MGQVWQVSPRGEKFPWKGRGLCHVTQNPFNISGMDEATPFNFGKWIDYGNSNVVQ